MRKVSTLALGATLLSVLAVSGAEAMTVAPIAGASDAGVTLVRDGCGPFGHRNRFGECRPNGPRPGFYGPRAFGPGPGYGGRRCVIRETYDGPRRICRW